MENNKKLIYYIYSFIKSYNPIVEFYKDDVMQEIQIAVFTSSSKGEIFKISNRLVYNLLRDYGHSRKKGKDNFHNFYFQNSYLLTEEQEQKIKEIENLYLDQNFTAKELCEKFGVKYEKSISKLLFNVLPKTKKGGARKNSGKKKIKLN